MPLEDMLVGNRLQHSAAGKDAGVIKPKEKEVYSDKHEEGSTQFQCEEAPLREQQASKAVEALYLLHL